MKILIIKNDGIGDLILHSGFISCISKQHQVDLITCKQNKEISEQLEVNQVFYCSRDNIGFRHLFSSFLDFDDDARLIRSLKKNQYDVAICLRRYIRKSTAVLMSFVKADHKLTSWQFNTNISKKTLKSLSSDWQHFLPTSPMNSELDYQVDALKKPLSLLGIDIDINSCSPTIGDTEIEQNKKASKQNKKVALNIDGLSSRWHLFGWQKIIEELSKINKCPEIFLIGSDKAKSAAKYLTEKNKCCTDLCGILSISEAYELYKECDVVVGNDTGLTHLSSLVAPKVIIIVGGGTFGHFFPWPNNKNQLIIYNPLDCFGCDWKCNNFKSYKACLTEIDVRVVANAVTNAVNGDFQPGILDASK